MGKRENFQYEYLRLNKYIPNSHFTTKVNVKKFTKKLSQFLGLKNSDNIILVGSMTETNLLKPFLNKYVDNVWERIFYQEDLYTDAEHDMKSVDQIQELAKRECDYMIILSEEYHHLVDMIILSCDPSFIVLDFYDWYEFLLKKRLNRGVINHKLNLKSFIKQKVLQAYKYIRPIYTSDILDKKLCEFSYCINYDTLFDLKKYLNFKFSDGKMNEWREFALRKLIEYNFQIKEFSSLFKYLEEYGKLANSQIDAPFLKKEIETILTKITQKINENEGIIVYWTDAVTHDEAENLGFLENVKRQSLCFENVYSHVPYTDSTMHSILMGKRYFEDHVTQKTGTENVFLQTDTVLKNQESLVKFLQENKYTILECGGNYIGLYFDQLNSEVYASASAEYKYIPSSVNLWDAMCAICEADKKIFMIIHADCESHHPYWHQFDTNRMGIGGVSLLDDESEYDEQRKVALDYLSNIVESNEKLFDDNKYTKIFMSDHGKGAPAYANSRIRSYMYCKGSKITNIGKEERLFSLIDFHKLIQWIVDPEHNNFSSVFSNYIYIENQDPYSKRFVDEIETMYSENKEIFDENYSSWAAFQGVLDNKYKVILFRNGSVKWFESKSDDEIQEIPENVEEYYLSLFVDEFEDLNQDKYQYVSEFYDKCKRKGYSV